MGQKLPFAGLLGAALVGAAIILPAAPSLAAPACTSPGPIGQNIAAVPWPQQVYGPDRLAGIADGARVVVAVIDSGVDAGHPQLAGQVRPGKDFLRPGDGQTDCVGHGTAVASIIAGRGRSGVGFRGLAPGAEILPIRVTERQIVDGQPDGTGVSAATLAEAVDWAVAHDADIINLSLATTTDNQALRAAVANAVRRDVVVVAAVGNLHGQGDPTPYPAAYPGVIGVAAVGADGQRAPDSQVGPYVDIAAPGVDITAAARVRGLANYSGTSFATPFVAGAAALIRQRFPELSAAEVSARILATADPAPGGMADPGYGHGLLDPVRAVTARIDPAQPEELVPVIGQPVQPRPDDRPRWQRVAAMTVAALGALAAIAITLVATAWPPGRTRRWRL